MHVAGLDKSTVKDVLEITSEMKQVLDDSNTIIVEGFITSLLIIVRTFIQTINKETTDLNNTVD